MHALGYIILTAHFFRYYSMWYTHVAMETGPLSLLVKHLRRELIPFECLVINTINEGTHHKSI